jgi:hypothetical protein
MTVHENLRRIIEIYYRLAGIPKTVADMKQMWAVAWDDTNGYTQSDLAHNIEGPMPCPLRLALVRAEAIRMVPAM